MFDSAAFPQSLCPFACAAAAPPFLCPVVNPCAAPGNASCATQCKYPACPATGLGVDDFDFTRDKCASAAPRDSCLVCLPAITDIYYQPPANVRDLLTMESCLVLYTPLYLAAGAQPSALGMIANCGNMFGFGWSSSTCPVSLPESAFVSLERSCSNPAVACTTCVEDILRIFRNAGVDASSDAVRVAQYNVLGTCIDVHLLSMFASGANADALAGIQACPSIAGFLVISTVSIGGVSALTFSAGIFGAAVAAVVNARPSDVSVQNYTDSAGVSRRRLRASAVDVHFSISCASAPQQSAIAAALRLAISSLALTAALRQGGLPANGVALKDLVLTDGPPATPSLQSSSAASATGTVAGSVVGSVVGAMLLAAAVLVLRRRRRKTSRLPVFPPVIALSADGSSHGRFRAMSAPPFFSESSSSLLPTATYSPMQGATSGSDDNASSGGGWRAVASHADELQMCEQVGQGAVATVYRALWRGSEVAVKVWDLPPDGFVVHGTRGGTIDVDAPEASFMREVELLSSLRHPNILAIYALVKQPPQMIMEYGAAGSLKDLLARSSLATLSWQRRLAICTSVASAVEFLHAQSPPIIHTDLKPANVVLTGHGTEALVAKVADFGVSWVARAELAAKPLLHGTPRYMAPEVARGQPITNSKAIDTYGVGMVMYDVAHINTAPGAADADGAPDAARNGLQTLLARESAGFAVAFAPHVPQPLRDLMRTALAVAPNDRPGLSQLRVRLEALTVQAAAW
jgi:LPXTG-motif cell wall-anchored protein